MGDRAWTRWGAALGFALGGFFDGILLHQILQWHHLLSLVPGMADLRVQMLWDGYFHALMYVVAVAALLGLWRSPGGSAWRLAGAVLAGFGLWHVVDALLSHWLLGLHRIRLDSAVPLAWDVAWLAAFGFVPLAAGWRLLRRDRAASGGARAALAIAALLTGGAAAWTLRPPPGPDFTTVVFAPGVSPAQALDALLAADGRLAWTSPDLAVAVVAMPAGNRLSLYRRGALFVGGAGLPAGCFNWSMA